MLISLYASFRWAGDKNCVFKIIVFILFASFLSAIADPFFLGYFGVYFFWIFHLFSFPLYSWTGERRIILAPPNAYSQRIPACDVRFLAKEILWLLPQGPVVSGGAEGSVRVESYRVILLSTEIGSIPPELPYMLFALCLFFIIVNTAGALLGYRLSKVQRIRELEFIDPSFLIAALVGVLILGVGIWLAATGGLNSSGQYYYGYDPSENRGQGIVCIVFGGGWLGMNLLSYVWTTEPRKYWDKKHAESDVKHETPDFSELTWRTKHISAAPMTVSIVVF